jgi:CRISPR-associated RAMP protein (TIGR02581 family)
MHGKLYNEAEFELWLRPRTPLLIKSGVATGLDPTMPDMAFVRTRRMNKKGDGIEEIYLPGSSLRGVLRAHAESLLRSIDIRHACDPFRMKTEQQSSLDWACLSDKALKERNQTEKKADKLSGPEAWKFSCYACRLFGNTGLASRLRVGDFYVDGDDPLTEVRHGVAIDRITGAVAQGPFNLETVTDGKFTGTLMLRNFTVGQLGLLAAALLDLSDGIVPIGHAKSRGLGRVELTFERISFRFPLNRNSAGKVSGIGALADEGTRGVYDLPRAEEDAVDANASFERGRKGAFDTLTLEGNDESARDWLDQIMTAWGGQLAA